MLASVFEYLYLIIVFILTFAIMSSYRGGGDARIANRNFNNNKVGFCLLVLFFILVIGLRPLSYKFVDMMNYNTDYHVFYYGVPFKFNWNLENFLFDNFFAWMGSMKFDISLFFLLIAALYFGGIAWAINKMFPKDYLLAFVMYLGAFSTFSYGTNGIKAGAAASIFLLALAYREKKILAISFLWLSLGFHHSMLAPIVAYLMASFYKNLKLYFYAWIGCLLLAAAHVSFFQTLFAVFTDEHGTEYLVADNSEIDVSGFRPDFIIYSAVPIFLGYYLVKKKYVNSEYYNFIWCVYTATNCVFLLCTYGSFINRIAYLSWLMFPIVLLYPFVNIVWSPHQDKYIKKVVYFHLYFTLFMTFIYYGLLRI